MRLPLVVLILAGLASCGGGREKPDAPPPADACVGIGCLVVNCKIQNKPDTTISGTVYAPNGTLALYNATVYIPTEDPGPLHEGVECGQCTDTLPGNPVARATSDETGKFTLTNVPSGNDIPLVIQIGKWRRQVLLENIQPCTDNPIDAEHTRLPKSHFEGDIPRIAITTGECDALECLIRRLGVADGEFTADTGTGRIHLYNGNGANQIGNTTLSPAQALWSNPNKLKNYDMVLMSCECSQNPTTKPQASMDNMKAYADIGGRLFMSHYHNIWISGETGNPSHAPMVWKDIATWTDNYPSISSDTIDQVNNPHGAAFAAWMQAVGGGSSGQVPIDSSTSRQTVNTMDPNKAERWIYWDNGGSQYPQDFQFTTPNEAPKDQRCGKVVFSDMHVTSEQSSSGTFPSGCTTSALTAQEKALAFMLFDIATCVQVVQ
ncbi:MAG: carboxypeptidase-like regulatory domain-containing protein [Acidobacteriota bacterium]